MTVTGEDVRRQRHRQGRLEEIPRGKEGVVVREELGAEKRVVPTENYYSIEKYRLYILGG